MKAIVAVDKNWGIGKDGGLLVHLPGDLKYFKEKTEGQTIVMGRKTLESLPGSKPLPNRENVVLTTDNNYKAEGCIMVHSLRDMIFALEYATSEEIYVCGGANIYEQLEPYCKSFLITKIFEEFPADKHFPNLDARSDEFEVTWESEIQQENGVKYQWLEYTRV